MRQRHVSLRWHGGLSAKVDKNANLGYSHDRLVSGLGFPLGQSALKWTVPKSMHISKNSQLVYRRGSFTSASIHC